MQEQLLIGKILKAHGLKGEVKVQAFADDLERFQQLKDVQLEDERGQILATLRVVRVRLAGREVFLSFRDYGDRSRAESLRGKWLSVPRERAQKLAEDSWYVCDLIGLEVYDQEQCLGRISEILDTGHQDLLLVTKDAEAPVYIPLRKAWLRAVDFAEGQLKMVLPEGLVELYRPQ